jgi:hypothetical protein
MGSFIELNDTLQITTGQMKQAEYILHTIPKSRYFANLKK